MAIKTKKVLPTTGNNSTGGLYGQFATSQLQKLPATKEMIQQQIADDAEKYQKLPYIINENNTPTAPIDAGSLQPITIGGNSTGGIFGGGLGGGNLAKPVNPSQYFDGSVVGTVSGGFSGGNKGGVTDEGVVKAPSNVENSTFNNTTGGLYGQFTSKNPLFFNEKK